MTMSHVRSLRWVSPLRRSLKSVIGKYYGCKKFRSLQYHSPKPRPLPKDRTEKCFPFEVISTDNTGPIYYKTKEKSELKAYILLFCCCVTRAVHIEWVSNLTTTEFIKSFKKLISRRGKLKIVYYDDAKTFKAGAKWRANINRDPKLHDFVSSETIIWKFNVPKASWWDGLNC